MRTPQPPLPLRLGGLRLRLRLCGGGLLQVARYGAERGARVRTRADEEGVVARLVRVRVRVRARVKVRVGVRVGVRVRVRVGVRDWVGVGVRVGVRIRVGVRVRVWD